MPIEKRPIRYVQGRDLRPMGSKIGASLTIVFAMFMLRCDGCVEEPRLDAGLTPCVGDDCVDIGDAGDASDAVETGDQDDTSDAADTDLSACSDDEHCADDEFCDLGNNLCEQGCRFIDDGDNCPDDQCCDASFRVCRPADECDVTCTQDDQCGDSEYCDVDIEHCRVGCRVDAVLCPHPYLGYCCEAGTTCDPDDHTCHDNPCSSDSECATFEFCFLDDQGGPNECRTGCRADPDNCASVWGEAVTMACDSSTRTCADIVCAQDTDCPSDPDQYVCDQASCRPGCLENADCADDQPCNLTSRRCECEGNDDCLNEETICFSNQCIERCHQNADCDEYCNVVSGCCFDECPDTETTTNDRPNYAENRGSDELIVGVICGTDHDWYSIDGNVGETVIFTVHFGPGEIELAAYDDSVLSDPDTEPGGSVSMSASEIGVVDFEFTSFADSPIYVSVSGWGATEPEACDSAVLGYVIEIERAPAGECRLDAADPVDDDIDDATEIDEGIYSNRSICTEDRDFYVFTLPPDQRAEISLSGEGDGDLDLILYDHMQILDDSSESEGASEYLEAGPLAEESEWFIEVVGKTAEDENRYTLSLFFGGLEACEPDELELDGDGVEDEGNDDPTNAEHTYAFIGLESAYSDLTACVDDDDWYTIDAVAGGQIDVAIHQYSLGRDILVEFRSPGDPDVIEASVRTESDLEWSHNHTTAENARYYVRIVDDGGPSVASGSRYDVTFQVFPPSCLDTFEENDDIASASNTGITPGTPTFQFETSINLACPGDEDFFRVPLARDGTISAAVAAGSYFSTFRLELLDSDGELIIASSILDSETCTVGFDLNATCIGFVDRVAPEGDVFLRIYNTGYIPLVGQNYDISVYGELDPLGCVDEGIEPNETRWQAAWITDDVDGQTVCPDEADYYFLHLTGPTKLEIDYDFVNPAPGVNSFLFEVPTSGDLIQRDFSLSASGRLSYSFFVEHNNAMVAFVADSPAEDGEPYSFDVVMTSANVCDPGRNIYVGLADRLSADAPVNDQLCDTESLFYVAALEQNANNTFTLTESHPDEQLRLSLLDENGDPIDGYPSAVTTSGTAVITVSLLYTGDYHVSVERVVGGDPPPVAGVPFTLTVETETVTVCDPDIYEENDTAPEGTLVGGDLQTTLTACPDDDDWYVFENTGLEERDLTIAMTQFSPEGAIRLSLYARGGDGNPDGDPIQTFFNATNKNIITAVEPGLYLVLVQPDDAEFPEGGIEYNLTIEFDIVRCEDYLEPNDIADNATVLGLGDRSFVDLTSCDADVDLFSFDIAVDGTQLDATVSRSAPSVAMTLRLLDATAPGTPIEVVNGGAGESVFGLVTTTSLDAGEYLLEITSTSPGDFGERYTFTTSLEEPWICVDPWEPNNDFDGATRYEWFVNPALMCVEDDVDVYLYAMEYGPFSWEATVSTGGESVAVQLYYQEVDETPSLLVGDPLSRVDQDAGNYYLQVTENEAIVGAGFEYTVSASTTLTDCPEDPLEPNDTFETASTDPDWGTTLNLCDDPDVFDVPGVTGGWHINVGLSHGATDCEVHIEIFHMVATVETVVAEIQNNDAYNSLWALGVSADDYYVRVSLADPACGAADQLGVAYEIQVDVDDESLCAHDGLEGPDRNETVENATEILSGVEGASICPADEDWFHFDVESNSADIAFELSFPETTNFGLQLYRDNNPAPETFELVLLDGCSTLACVTGTGRVDCTDGTPIDVSDEDSPYSFWVYDLEAGTYYVHVTAVSPPNEGWTYEMDLTVAEIGCFSDECEGNDAVGEACVPTSPRDGEPLESGGPAVSYVLCPSDNDYLEVTTTTGGVIEISVASLPPSAYGSDSEAVGVICPLPAPELPTPDRVAINAALIDTDTVTELARQDDITADDRVLSIVEAGDYYVHIAPEEMPPDLGQPYRFRYWTYPPCEDDVYEGPEDDSGGAWPHVDYEPIDGSTLEHRTDPEDPDSLLPPLLYLCPGDLDVIEFVNTVSDFQLCVLGGGCECPDEMTCPSGYGYEVVSLPADLEVQVRFDNLVLDATVELWWYDESADPGSEWTILDTDTDPWAPPVTVQTRNFPPETSFYVASRVDEPTPNREAYTIEWFLETACSDDGFEENDSLDDPEPLSLDVAREAALCTDDVDVWQIPVEAGLPVRVTVTGPVYDALIELYDDSTGVPEKIGADWETTQTSSLFTAFGAVGGSYNLYVLLQEGRMDEYEILVTQDECFPDPADDSGDNETLPTAFELEDVGGEFAICPVGDVDWFRFEVTKPAGQCTRLRLGFAPGVLPDGPWADYGFITHLTNDGGTPLATIAHDTATPDPVLPFMYSEYVWLDEGSYYVNVFSEADPFVAFSYNFGLESWSACP